MGKRKKKCANNTSFAQYWEEMSAYNKMLQKNLQHIIKSNKYLRYKKQQKEKKKDKQSNEHTHVILGRHPELKKLIPSFKIIRHWLAERWPNMDDYKIKNIITRFVLNKFLARGNLNNVQIVYHGTGSYNDASIIQKGLVTGGTKGVSIANGSAYGHGIYCSPSIHTAGSYARGSLFICLVRANRCRKSGNIYVVPHDDDILPIYLASFEGYVDPWAQRMRGNILMTFAPGWTPLNVDEKASK